jgi:hypothetical protein
MHRAGLRPPQMPYAELSTCPESRAGKAKTGVLFTAESPQALVLISFQRHAPHVRDRLATYPYVVVRVGCELCKRQGSYRLARLAAKFGPDIAMEALLDRLASDCEARNARHPYRSRCAARFIDLDPPRRPPDAPRTMLRVVGGKE